MKHEHLQNGKNGINLYGRKYLGEGKYFQRGLCKDIKIGDEWTCSTEPNKVIKVDKIIKIRDAKGIFKNPNDAKNAYFEAEFIDESFVPKMEYIVLSQI